MNDSYLIDSLMLHVVQSPTCSISLTNVWLELQDLAGQFTWPR